MEIMLSPRPKQIVVSNKTKETSIHLQSVN